MQLLRTEYILPFITIGEFHIETVTTEERFTVQGDLNVGWVRNGFTYQHQARHGRLLVATVSLIIACVIYTYVSSAVQYLWDSYTYKETRLLSVRQHRRTSISAHRVKHPPPHLSTLGVINGRNTIVLSNWLLKYSQFSSSYTGC